MRVLRALIRLILATVGLASLLLAATVVLPLIPGPGPDLSGPPARTIALIQGPIHTDILFPLTPEVRARFAFAEAAGVPVSHPGAEWLMLGWGSQAFYTTAGTYADITASAVFTAVTGDSAVIRLDVTGPLDTAPNLRTLTLSEAQFQALLSQTAAAIASPTALAQPGFTGSDAFFPAQGRFHAFRTCNAWLGETFRASGIPFGLWTPANWSVTLALDWHLSGQDG
ncbi:MAG: hypothetical protein B7Y02_13630 [Rhodobacterales bacterium 17-64-5]|nr:MAG: hypothetical protein B7Z31_10705 [Rhodobacterales bacterium 12-65-15]OZA07652.1 MAG: hypothetical protein B7Y02_13630 [Rhodobacterales bacterium 17-64-5]